MAAFAFTIFLGAFLLFQVQPLIGKYILPWFGGSPGVWTTCMLFFQMLLLAGYAYAHALTSWLNPKGQVLVHVLFIIAALLTLPISPAETWKPHGPGDPVWRILGLLLTTLGLPYLVLSATGPLMQAWFNRAHPHTSPYRLYALSNFGSLLALLSYPAIIEPALARRPQALWWSWGVGIFAVGAAFCAWQVWRTRSDPKVQAPELCSTRNEIASLDRALWFLLPACASVLLLAITNTMCQDIAVIPFLWILPLSLYLLTFIISFECPRLYSRRWFTLAYILGAVFLCDAQLRGSGYSLPVLVGATSLLLVVSCMICHAEVYALRPPAGGLTRFYLYLAAGGASGGLFVAVLAPRLFNSLPELPWGYWACGLFLALLHVRNHAVLKLGRLRIAAWRLAVLVLLFLAVALGIETWLQKRSSIDSSRNFYGVLRVLEYFRDDPRRHGRVLGVGQTIHGHQFVQSRQANMPTTYFHEQSGIGLALTDLPRPPARRLGVIGLGVGTLAAYAQPGDTVRFYEINPAVEQMALKHFTYLRDCRGRAEVVLGDARLTLEREPPQDYDVLVLDAFSGDAIPAHLLTREVIKIYLRHLRPGGFVAANITNKHLDLRPVLQRHAAEFNLHTVIVSAPGNPAFGCLDSLWVLLSPDPHALQTRSLRSFFAPLRPEWRNLPLWTDEYFSLFPLLK